MVWKELQKISYSKTKSYSEVAEAIGITDGMFSRKLRRELPEAEQRKILDIVANLARRKEAETHENAGT